MNYEWDPEKAITNRRKHGIDFADAVAVLEDDRAITIPDDHPDEECYATIGKDMLGRILVVIYTSHGENVRLISARKATGRERTEYEAS